MNYDDSHRAFTFPLTLPPGRCFVKVVIDGAWLLIPGHHFFADHRGLMNNMVEVQPDGSVKFFEDLSASFAALHGRAVESGAALTSALAQVSTLQANLTGTEKQVATLQADLKVAQEFIATLQSAHQRMSGELQTSGEVQAQLKRAATEEAALRAEIQQLSSSNAVVLAEKTSQHKAALERAVAAENAARAELDSATLEATLQAKGRLQAEQELSARGADLRATQVLAEKLEGELGQVKRDLSDLKLELTARTLAARSADEAATTVGKQQAALAARIAGLEADLQYVTAERDAALLERDALSSLGGAKQGSVASPPSSRRNADEDQTPSFAYTPAKPTGKAAPPGLQPWRSPMAISAGAAGGPVAVNSVAKARQLYARGVLASSRGGAAGSSSASVHLG